MAIGSDRDPVAAALAAIKGFFVEPVEGARPGFDAVPGGWPQGAEAAGPPLPEGFVPGPGVLRASPSVAGSPEQASLPAPPPAAPAVEPPVPVVPGPDAPRRHTSAPAPPPHTSRPAHARRPRPVIAVFGLAPGCGASTVAHALAVELAARDPARVAAVRSEPRRAGARGLLSPGWLSGTPLSGSPVGRLAGTVADFPGAEVRIGGRLCVVAGADRAGLAEGVPHLAPLVLDEGSAAIGRVAAAVADRSVLVTTPALEPALAAVAAECIARVGPDPIVLVNRVPEAGPTPAGPLADPRSARLDATRLSEAVLLPESRLAARLALRGKEPRGELQRAVVRLADRCCS